MGTTQPVASDETAAGRSENRRVTVKVLVNLDWQDSKAGQLGPVSKSSLNAEPTSSLSNK